MPIEIINNDITKVHAYAILHMIKSSLLNDESVDGDIHKGKTREIYAVVPVWHDGKSNDT